MNAIVKNNNLGNLFDELFSTIPNAWNKENALPPVNITEDENGYHLQLIAAGLQKDDFKINLEKGLLTISYEKQHKEDEVKPKSHRIEYTLNSFKRSFNVDENIDTENITAGYESGILNINLPKKQEVKVLPKQIAIQ